MSHLTSLLMCLISAVNNVATLQNARSSMPEARSGPSPWEQRYAAVSPKSIHPHRPDDLKGLHKPSSVIDPKSFSIEVGGSSTDEQDLGSSQVFSGKSENPNKHSKDSGWHLKLSFPSMTTTGTPTSKSDVKEKNIFRYLGSSQGKVWPNHYKFPGDQKPDNQKPSIPHKQSQLVKILDKLLQGGSSEQSGQTQRDKVVFKPLMQQQLSHSHTVGPFSSLYNPNLYGMGQAHSIGSTDAPVYQSVHYTPKWVQLHKPQTSDEDLIKSISQYVQNVNGRLMIPIDKCPGFEKFEELLKGHYYQHVKFPYGYVHQYGQPPKMHIPQQGKPPHIQVQYGKPPYLQVDQQGQDSHIHVYKPWMTHQSHIPTQGPTSPSNPTMTNSNYAEYFQYGGGPAPSPSEPSQEPNDYLKWWQNKYPGGHQQHPKPGQTYTYVYQKPDQQQSEQPQHIYYKVPVQIPYYAPQGWR